MILRQILWVMSIGGIFASMAWLVSNLPEPPNRGAESSISLGEPRQSSSLTNFKGQNPFPQDIENKKIGPEWCATGTEKKKKLPEPIFALFREWISSHANLARSVSLKEKEVGLNLAKKRRVTLKKLIQANPRLALQQIIPSTTRKNLPSEICAEFADIVSGVGNLEVLHACFGPQKGYQQTIFRTLRMRDGKKYNVSTYGQRALLQEKRGLSVLGAAIDGELALLDSPARILDEVESAESGLPRNRVHVEICGEFLEFPSREKAVSFRHRSRRLESRGGKILDYEAHRASGQVLNSTTYQYQVLDVNLSWQNARIVAQGLGGDLAEINSTSERKTIAKLIGNSGLGSAWVLNQENLTLFVDEHNETNSTFQKGFVVEYPLTPFANASRDSNATVVRVLVIPARYKNQDTQASGLYGNFSPRTSREIYREMEATRTFYLRESNGRCRLDYNTTGTVTLPEDDSFYDWASSPPRDSSFAFSFLTSHALAAAVAEGYDISGYDKFVFITTKAHSGYGGLGGGSFAHCPGWQSGVIIHELGHCFGLPHANQWVSYGESPISDDGFDIDYGNPLSVMGGSGHMESPDEVVAVGAEESEGTASFTLWAKDIISANDPEGFYRTGQVSLPTSKIRGCDVLEIESNSSDSMVLGTGLIQHDANYSNFYRIYHHDFDLTEKYLASLPLPQQEFLRENGIAPYGLKEGTFLVSIPSSVTLFDDYEANGSIAPSDRTYLPKFVGSGNDVNATLTRLANGNFNLTIINGGSGFCVEPSLVFAENSGTGFEVSVQKDWIGMETNGTFTAVTLLEKADWALSSAGFARGLRGIVAPSSPFGPDGANALEWNATTNQFVEVPVSGQYWVGYRREYSHRGLTLTLSNKLLDMTRETQEKYSDGALLIGRTYSDYGTDFHVTPIRHGGTYPMEYIDVVVRYKTHNGADGVSGNEDDNNSAPVVHLMIDKQFPKVGEQVSLTASILYDPDQDDDFAYAWYVNDVMLSQEQYLNKPSLSYGFDKVGFQKIRVEVSDMKGGVASISKTVEVGNPEKQSFSNIDGRVLGDQGKGVRGLRVVAQKALPIMHHLTWESSADDNRFNSFFIDGKESPDLVLHRGQWHRFMLDESLKDVSFSLNEETDRHPPVIIPKMGLRLHLLESGAGYATSPKVSLNGLFDQEYQDRFILGTDWHENAQAYLDGTKFPESMVLKMPRIESILYPTQLSEVKLLHGGRGYEDPGDYLTVVVDRNKTWHTYHPWIPQFVADANRSLSVNPEFNGTLDRTDVNATLIDANITARIDGVGTIRVTRRGDGYPGAPSIAVIGRGQDVNATGTIGGKKGIKNDELGAVSISATGFGYDEATTFAVATYPANPRAYWSFDSISTRPTMVPRTPNWTDYVKPNLAHRWKFDELVNNGSSFADSIGDSNLTGWNAGALIGSNNYYVAGKHWGALDLNGTATEITPPVAVDPSKGLTVSLWARVTENNSSDHDFISMGDGGTNGGFSLYVDLTGNDACARARAGTQASPQTFNPQAFNVFGANAWVHLALAFTEQNGTSGTWSFYVNGDLSGEEFTEIIPTAGSIKIGDAFVGQIDELEIYTRGLSVAEIRELAGIYVLDSGGNDTHGVLVGGGEASVVTGAGNSKVSNALDLNGSTYVDLFPSIGVMNSMPRGTITAWYATNGRRGGNGAWEDMTILSASDKDDNSSALRLMIRDTGQIGFSVKNDGSEVVDVYTEKVFRDPDSGEPDEWHHLAIIVDDNGTEIYVDGKKTNILASTGSVDARGFFSDVQNIDSITLGRHFCSNVDQTEIFEGRLDEVYLFDRVLSPAELQYMIDEATLNTVEEASVVPSIDAIGTVKLIDGGSGYREIPSISFVGTHTGGTKDMAIAEASLVPTKLDDLAFVDFDDIPLVDTAMSNDLHGLLAQFVFGFRLPPTVGIDASPSNQDEDAVAKNLYFIPETGGYYISSPGSGFVEDWITGDDTFVISGRGSKPPVFEPVMEPDPHHEGFFRIAAIRLKERGYGPYDNNTTYLLEQRNPANGKVEYYYLNPQFITGGDVAAPFNSRFVGDSGYAGYPMDTYPARLKVNIADAADVATGLAYSKGDIMSMEVIAGGKYNFGPPDKQDIVGGVGYRKAPVIDFSGLTMTHRLAIDGSKTKLHQVFTRANLVDRGKGYRKPLEIKWHGGYLPDNNASSIVYPKITGVQIDENGSIASISVESNATTNVPNWENLTMSITGAGGTGASAELALSFLGGPIVDMNGSNATIITDWLGQAVGIFTRGDENATGVYYDGWRTLFAFDGNLSNDIPTQYAVTPFWDWIAIPESNATGSWVNGITIEGVRYFWETNGSLYRFLDTAREQKDYFDGNGTIDEAYGSLLVNIQEKGKNYDPPGDANRTTYNSYVLGSELNATLQPTWVPALPASAVEKNATFEVRLGGVVDTISPYWRGSGYVGPKVVLSGDGSGAILHPVIKDGRLEKIVIEDSGIGYSDANVTIVGGAGLDFDGKPFSKESGNELIEANCSAVIKDGRIIEVRVDFPGWGYFQPEIVVTGSGSGVEAVPVIGDYKVKNTNVKDGIVRVFIIDGGDGFTERPWLNERPVVEVLDYTSDRGDSFDSAGLRARLVDNQGSRVGAFAISDAGSYDQASELTGQITFNYPAGENERNATATGVFDRVLEEVSIIDPTNRSLTIPGTSFKMLGVYGSDSSGAPIMDGNGSRAADLNSSMLERPEIVIANTADFTQILQTEGNSLNNVFGNGRDYNSSRSHNYVDVFVGNDFPTQSFYHLRDYMGLPTGGSVEVRDSVPGLDWWNILDWQPNKHYAAGHIVLFHIPGEESKMAYEATTSHFSGGSFPGLQSGLWRDLTTDKDHIDGKAAAYSDGVWGYIAGGAETYTDSNGYYSFNDLEYGIYNLTVFHEDERLQSIAYLASGNSDSITKTVALEGIPELVLEASGERDGNCTLVWSQETIRRAGPGSNSSFLSEVGFGFHRKPVLRLSADPENAGRGTHSLDIVLTPEGALDLTITAAAFHDLGDKYYLGYRSSRSGVDFWNSDWNSSGVAPVSLTIAPDAAANAVEVPIFEFAPGDISTAFNATAWDINSDIVLDANATWSWFTDIPLDRNESDRVKSSENNNSEIAEISPNGSLVLYSTLRKGRVLSVDIQDGGQGYVTDLNASKLLFTGSTGQGAMARISEVNAYGSVTRVDIIDPGEGYSNGMLSLTIIESNGTGALLRPVVGSGRIALKATLDSNSSIFAETNASAAMLHVLDSNVTWSWLDRYFDSFKLGFVNMDDDNDSDGLTNQQELELLTNPTWSDSDGDGLDDHNESQNLGTNPLLSDTDNDGLSDFLELIRYNTDATKFDTDGDGWSDGLEVAYGLSPTTKASGTGYVSGTVYYHGNLTGKLYISPFEIVEGATVPMPSQEFVPAAATYYFLNNLQAGVSYTLFAFIDRNGNKIRDNGEPFGSYDGSWDGMLSGNKDQINITVVDPAPGITIFGESVIELSPGETFTDPGAFAYDVWESEIVLVVRSGNATSVMTSSDYNSTTGESNWVVQQDAPRGVYHLKYSATDSSGSTGTATRILMVRDILPPTISLVGSDVYGHESGVSFEDPGYFAYDVVDGNLTSSVTISGVVGTIPGTYYLSYSVNDLAGNAATPITRSVQVVDTTPPQITLAGGSTVNVDRGSSWEDPGYSAYDSLDGDISSKVSIEGLPALDLNQTGSHLLTYTVLDSSNNLASSVRTVYVADWNFTLAGRAMDGYLVGSSVIFDINDDGIHDLSAEVKTDQRGAFTIAFTNQEFALVDSNKNGVIDPGEGKIKVSGGIDSSTMEPFSGSYEADANSSVVTPLTSILSALVDEGLSRENAKSKVAETMGIPSLLDISTYDAIAASAKGDPNSVSTLVASARVANSIRQTVAFMDFVSDGNFSDKSTATLLLTEVAKKIASGGGAPLGDVNEMKSALDTIVSATGYMSLVDPADVIGAAQLSARADEMIVEAFSVTSVPHSLAAELAKIQAVIEDSVVSGYDKLRLEGGTTSTLAEALTKELLSGQIESFSGVNVFPPSAPNGEVALPYDRHASGVIVYSVAASDLDGDDVQFSISSGNTDADLDGINAFSVNSQGQILIADSDDLSNLSNGQAKIEILLSDGKGLYGSAAVTVILGNPLSLESTEVEGLVQWKRSSWFGDFYSNGSSWIYHQNLGWLYVYPDPSGYWLWVSGLNSWLWTSPETYPYFFKYGGGWLYLDASENSSKIYDYFSKSWIEL